MCGITGILFPPGSRSREATLSRVAPMVQALAHRGPDGEGIWCNADKGVALGHRRLAVIDVSDSGRQPMIATSGRYAISFNGEIYNYREMRESLVKEGATFRGASDTEVLLASIEIHGLVSTLERCEGMFAFSLWDEEARVLYLARDRFGEKPLYYGAIGGEFAFASELKSLRVHPEFSGDVDDAAVAAYFEFQFVPAPLSIYRGIFKLPPASFMTVRYDESLSRWVYANPVIYWSACDVARHAMANPFRGTRGEAVALCDTLLHDAVRSRMVSDVPLGAFLSGGVDSSLVVAMMRRSNATRLKTFSIGFAEASHDESTISQEVAAILGTDHTALVVGPDEALAVAQKMAGIYDEPFADSSQIPTFLVSRLARHDVTVALSGDGGDELFGGYNRHVFGGDVWRRCAAVPKLLRSAFVGAMSAVPAVLWDRLSGVFGQRHFGDKAQKLAWAMGASGEEDFYRRLFARGEDGSILSAHAGTSQTPWNAYWDASRGFMENAMLCDTSGYLPDDILVKLDRASMAVNLEARAPFLDRALFTFAWSLPPSFKVSGGKGKLILRDVLSQHIPRKLFDRPKTGFHMPIGEWLRGPLREWAEDMMASHRVGDPDRLERKSVVALWREHLSGKRNHEERLWAILMWRAWEAQ